jgi:hypothetical protein
MLVHKLITFPAWQICLVVTACIIASYVVHQIFIHPLARFPGPLLCRLTDIKKLQYFASLHVDEKIVELHQKYGPIVRIAPNELSFWGAEAVAPIYKSGRSMIKAPFYNGFTALKPNLFGTRDEEVSFKAPCLTTDCSQRSRAVLTCSINVASCSTKKTDGPQLLSRLADQDGSHLRSSYSRL